LKCKLPQFHREPHRRFVSTRPTATGSPGTAATARAGTRARSAGQATTCRRRAGGSVAPARPAAARRPSIAGTVKAEPGGYTGSWSRCLGA